ncbi:hypothetical protein B0H15DRAFT_945039 [Mycena belliarum]|uniref:Uncharacterized protein n=1 Tax=Mycena belliarum TaxID=1033014 RepID=A0AAD6UBW8_9AGAR|nr:hypothetical protein B0H15DRAFT_945039 [Mycena belliae]
MSSIALASPNSPPFVHDPNPSTPYEPVQYLSRKILGLPLPPVIIQHSENPAEIIDAAVARQWTKYHTKEPYDVRPTFSAAPQSEYYGTAMLNDGQLVHKSAAKNVYRAFYDQRNGSCFAFPCHEVTWSFQAASETDRVWPRELFYPSEARLHDAMKKMLPPPSGNPTEIMAFPAHSMLHPPPLPSIEERLRAPYANATGREDIDAIISNFIERHKPSTAATVSPTASPDTPLTDEVVRDIEARVAATLEPNDTEGGLSSFTINFGVAPDETVGRASAPSEDNSDEDAGPYPRSCAYCAAPQHRVARDCPLWAADAAAMAPSMKDAAGNPGGATDIRNPSLAGLQSALDQIMGRTIDELLHDPPPFPASDIVPLRDALQAAPNSDEAVRRLKLVLAQHYAEEMDAREVAAAVLTFPQDDESDSESGSDGSMPDLEEIRPSPPRVLFDLRSWADRVETPVLNHQRGGVVTRDRWSSSPAPTSPEYSSASEESFRVPAIRLSPVLSEWSVTDSELNIDPQIIIDSAVSSALSQLSDEHSDPAAAPTTLLLSPPSDDPVHSTNAIEPLTHASPPGDDQTLALDAWLRAGLEGQNEHIRWEDEAGGAPLLSALRTLHGPLRAYMDFVFMAAEESQRSGLLAALSGSLHLAARSATPSPDLSQSPTSLDFSLPTPKTTAAVTDTLETAIATTRDGKRKAGDSSGEGREDKGQKRPRKFQGDLLWRTVVQNECLKAAHAVQYQVLNHFKGVRMAVLESTRRIEYMVWQRYKPSEVRAFFLTEEPTLTECAAGYLQNNFPSHFSRHPFLLDLEAAKLHVLRDVLYLHERYTLAALIDDILSVRLTKQEGLADLLSASALDAHNPYAQYWELLPYPDTALYPTQITADRCDYLSSDPNDIDSDSDMGYDSYSYPDSDTMQTPERGGSSGASSPSWSQYDDRAVTREEQDEIDQGWSAGSDWSNNAQYQATWSHYSVSRAASESSASD